MATETSSAVGNGYARHLGGTVETVLSSPRIAPPPATLEEARNQPGRREKIQRSPSGSSPRASSTSSSSRSRSPAA